MTRPERFLLIFLGIVYAAGILLALLVTGHLATYLPHAAVLLACAAAVRAMLHDRRGRPASAAAITRQQAEATRGARRP